MNGSTSEPRERLLLALAEQLKLPLIQISHGAELGKSQSKTSIDIPSTAAAALQLIDSYILSLAPNQASLDLEPVSISAVLQDASHRLSYLASQYGCELQLQLSGRYGPVMANKQNLEVAFVILGQAFIESHPRHNNERTLVVMGAHKNARGLVAGIFGSQADLSGDMFRRAKALYGTARQPLVSTNANTGVGVFIADTLLQSMAANLKPARYKKLAGLATTLLPSKQLSLVETA